MKLDLFNIDDFVKMNHLEEVTSPIGLTAAKMPNPNGIFSYEIFGYTTEERKNTFAYIDLCGNYFHPQCLKVLNRMGSLGKIAFGEKYAVIADNKIHPLDRDQLKDFPDAETGTEFFYNNWDKIDWSRASVLTTDKTQNEDELSIDKKNRLKFFKLLKREEAFVRKWLVLPPYYRDFNAEDTTMGDDINKVYKELILKTMALKKGFADEFGFSSVGAMTKNRIQDLICILYDISLGPVTGKTIDINTREMAGNSKRSLLKRNLIGRFLDFSASSVITSPVSSQTETVEDFARYGIVQLPLQTFMAMYKPFFINFCQQGLESYAEEFTSGDLARDLKRIDSSQWSVSEVDKIITRFIKSASEKDEPIEFEYINKDNEPKWFSIMCTEYDQNKKELVNRPVTYLDLFYIAAEEIAVDKYSMNTRYPVANNQNIYAAKIKVLSTNKTRHIYLESPFSGLKEYKHYPYIGYDKITKDYGVSDPTPKPKVYYDIFRATIIGNGVIKSLGADYDGDMMFFRGLFTKEANAEAEKLIWRKTNFFSADGSLSRGLTKISKDCTIALYELTKN